MTIGSGCSGELVIDNTAYAFLGEKRLPIYGRSRKNKEQRSTFDANVTLTCLLYVIGILPSALCTFFYSVVLYLLVLGACVCALSRRSKMIFFVYHPWPPSFINITYVPSSLLLASVVVSGSFY